MKLPIIINLRLPFKQENKWRKNDEKLYQDKISDHEETMQSLRMVSVYVTDLCNFRTSLTVHGVTMI